MRRPALIFSIFVFFGTVALLFNNCTEQPLSSNQGKKIEPSFAGGFWDPGFKIGTWRTDFNDITSGASTSPLTLAPCQFDLATDLKTINGAGPTYWNENTSSQVSCDQTSTSYANANSSTSAPDWPNEKFWVVAANNDRSFGPEGACSDLGPNTGPPNQSKKVQKPGQGVFGIDVTAGKMTLAIDTNNFPNCVSPVDKGKFPFFPLVLKPIAVMEAIQSHI